MCVWCDGKYAASIEQMLKLLVGTEDKTHGQTFAQHEAASCTVSCKGVNILLVWHYGM